MLKALKRNQTGIKVVFTFILSLLVYLFSAHYFGEAARRVAAIFIFAACFWSLEIVPLYTTSLIVVLALIFSLCFSPHLLDEPVSYKYFLSAFASPVIMLFLGGFVLARMMNKYRLDSFIAHTLARFFGHTPYRTLLGFMLTTALLSMWVSNTATTAMMLSMIKPILKQFDKNDPFKKGFVLAIPFGANIGGMGTPVGTPPNAIALGLLSQNGIHVSFISWMLVVLPLVIFSLFIMSLILYFLFPSSKKEIRIAISDEKLSGKRAKAVAFIVLFIVFLWLSSSIHHIPEAIVALLGVGIFSAFGFLSRMDLKKIDWDVLVLMWGGLALGRGIQVSQIAHWLVSLPIFAQKGAVLIALFASLSLFLSSFMSHTVAANLLFPLLLSVATESPLVLVVTCALASSFAMALPISTPPNAMAFSTGLLKSKDMIKAGAPIAVLGLVILIIGYRYVIPWII